MVKEKICKVEFLEVFSLLNMETLADLKDELEEEDGAQAEKLKYFKFQRTHFSFHNVHKLILKKKSWEDCGAI